VPPSTTRRPGLAVGARDREQLDAHPDGWPLVAPLGSFGPGTFTATADVVVGTEASVGAGMRSLHEAGR
jgi:hypothetical protein